MSLGSSCPARSITADVRALDVAVHDAELVRGVHDLAQAREQRPEDRRRDRPAPDDELVERRAAHVLHRDPQDAVGLGAERVDVRGVRVIEPRRELGLAQEAVDPDRRDRALAPEHLDHRGAPELRLLRAIDIARSAAPELLDDLELAERASDQGRRRRGSESGPGSATRAGTAPGGGISRSPRHRGPPEQVYARICSLRHCCAFSTTYAVMLTISSTVASFCSAAHRLGDTPSRIGPTADALPSTLTD